MDEFVNIEDRDRVAANHQNGDAAAGDAGNDGPHELRRNHRRFYNAPFDPDVLQMQGHPAQPRPLRRHKKRSLFTIAKKSALLENLYPPVMSTLLLNAKQAAMQADSEEQRSDYFSNYLMEHMTSTNYPNGVGLPERWGQF